MVLPHPASTWHDELPPPLFAHHERRSSAAAWVEPGSACSLVVAWVCGQRLLGWFLHMSMAPDTSTRTLSLNVYACRRVARVSFRSTRCMSEPPASREECDPPLPLLGLA